MIDKNLQSSYEYLRYFNLFEYVNREQLTGVTSAATEIELVLPCYLERRTENWDVCNRFGTVLFSADMNDEQLQRLWFVGGFDPEALRLYLWTNGDDYCPLSGARSYSNVLRTLRALMSVTDMFHIVEEQRAA